MKTIQFSISRPKYLLCSLGFLNRNLIRTVLFSLTFWAMLLPARAEILIHEGFDYGTSDGLLLKGRAGGSGWLGSWQSGNNATLKLAADPGNLSGSQPGQAKGIVGRVYQIAGQSSAYRDFAAPLSLIRPTDHREWDRYYLGIWVKPAAGSRFRLDLMSESREIRWAMERLEDGTMRAQAALVSRKSDTALCPDGVVSLLVSCFDRRSQTVSIAVFSLDQVRAGLVEPMNWPLQVKAATAATLSRIDIRVTVPSVEMDDLRLATAFADLIAETVSW